MTYLSHLAISPHTGHDFAILGVVTAWGCKGNHLTGEPNTRSCCIARADGGEIIDFAYYNHFDLVVFSFPLFTAISWNVIRTWLCTLAEAGNFFSLSKKSTPRSEIPRRSRLVIGSFGQDLGLLALQFYRQIGLKGRSTRSRSSPTEWWIAIKWLSSWLWPTRRVKRTWPSPSGPRAIWLFRVPCPYRRIFTSMIII